MIRASRIALGVGGQFTRMTVGFAGMTVLVAAMVATPGLETRAKPGAVDREQTVDTVSVAVPEGMLAKSLTITDPSGRDLATLTYWYTGETAMVARQPGWASVSCWLDRKNRTIVELTGEARRTRIEMNPDGTMQTFVTPGPGPRHQDPAPGESLQQERMKIPLFSPIFVWPICTLARQG